METGRTDSNREVNAQLELPIDIKYVAGLHLPLWVVRCEVCRRYQQSSPSITLARIKARRHVNNYGHTVVARLTGTGKAEIFSRTDDVEELDNEIPPY